MKAVTISKGARLIIVIAVAIILAIPVYGGLQSFQMEGTNFVQVDSEYELSNMTEGNIVSNISTVIGDSDEYTIVYGDTIAPVKTSDLNALATAIKASGAETATLLGPDGKIAKQQMIIGSNGLSQYVYTGIKLSSSLINTVTPTIDINARTPNGTNKISNVEVTAMEDTYKLLIEIPMVAVASALYLDSSINLDIGIAYSNIFQVNVGVDLPPSMFRPEGTPPMPVPVVSPDQKSITAETSIGIPENISATVGDVAINVTTDGHVSVVSNGDLSVIDSLKNTLEKDGKLTLDPGAGKDPIVIEKETAASIIDMLDQILKQVAA